MNIRRIVTPSDPLYADCVRIYENSFPYAERRDTAGMTEYLKDDRLHFLAFYGDREEDGPYGFFTFWDFGHGYLYGEHSGTSDTVICTESILRWILPEGAVVPARLSWTISKDSADLCCSR